MRPPDKTNPRATLAINQEKSSGDEKRQRSLLSAVRRVLGAQSLSKQTSVKGYPPGHSRAGIDER